ncbi:histidine kinase [Thermaerobacter marianensis DSM 12885]|uniref:histidine kinase n=1 Tax=Thermaerobacter marianensis (strain ATCC 700841 / DSM 12885 / JCM 10246 / 7p75a) TaxID=644966 RepID=E6SJY8_THEM7|nr:HAMP domain-containing sensor histidine kinase [Thermaerobacter marianensis]ADU52221.1 histidine kinase [Thermaerobacter marianensis DSM 12885]
MFDAARRRLTLWNLVIIVLVLAVFGAGVYGWTAARLVDQVDSALAYLAGRVAREVAGHQLAGPENAWMDDRPGTGAPPDDLQESQQPRQPGETGSLVRPASDPEERGEPGDVFERLRGILQEQEPGRPQAALLVGTKVAWRSPGTLDGFPSAALALEAGRRGRPVVTTLVLGGRPWRVRAEPLPRVPVRGDRGGEAGAGEPGELPVVQVALPLAAVQDSLAALLRVLVLAGAGGVGLAAVAGYAQAWRALRPIREAMERQRLFTAGASHEMRTPLAVIRADAELLAGELQDPDQRRLARDIVEEADRLARLIEDLLTLARGNGPEPVIEPRPCDLAALVGEAVRAAQPLAAPRGVVLDYQVGAFRPGPAAVPSRRPEPAPGALPDAPRDAPASPAGASEAPALERGSAAVVPARVDPSRIRQLVLILLSNAIRYTDPGTTVTVRLVPGMGPRGYHRLTVDDEGPGIPPADLERIFEPFYRGDAARARATGGFGLGLAVARWIVERHGGRIRASNRQPRGARFEVELPARTLQE